MQTFEPWVTGEKKWKLKEKRESNKREKIERLQEHKMFKYFIGRKDGEKDKSEKGEKCIEKC